MGAVSNLPLQCLVCLFVSFFLSFCLFSCLLHKERGPCSTGEIERVQTKQAKMKHKLLNSIKHWVTGKD